MMEVFALSWGPEVIFGQGASLRPGEIAWRLDIERILLVSDEGLAEAGAVRYASDILDDYGVIASLSRCVPIPKLSR